MICWMCTDSFIALLRLQGLVKLLKLQRVNLRTRALPTTMTYFWMILIRGVCCLSRVYSYLLLMIYSFISVPSPKVGETNIGDRDPQLEHTYKGLPKLRYVQTLRVIC